MMSDAILVALVGFIAAIIGGLLNAYFQRNAQDRDFSQKAKRQFYDELIDLIWDGNIASDQKERDQIRNNFIKRCNKIAIYGSDAVVQGVVELIEISNNLDEKNQWKVAKLISAMRADLGNPTNHETVVRIHKIMFERRSKSQ